MADELMLEIVTPEKMVFSGRLKKLPFLERKVSSEYCAVTKLF